MDWKEYSLGELLDYEQPAKYIVNSTEYNNAYKTPVLTAGKSFIIGYTNEKDGVFEELPVIIFDDFTTATKYVNFRFKVKSSAMKILKPKKELVNPKFIYYRMQNIQFDHSTHKRYWLQHYSKLRVAIPDLIEQQRIVSRIEELFSELDAGIEELKKAKEKLLRYRLAVINESLGKVKKHIPLREIIEKPKYGTSQKCTYQKEPNMIGVFRIPNVLNGRLSNDDMKYTFLSDEEKEKVGLRKNDILIIRSNGSPSIVGKTAIVKERDCCNVFAGYLIRIRFLNPSDILAKYVQFAFESHKGRCYIRERAKSTSGVNNINAKEIEQMMIPICSEHQMEKIVEEIEERLPHCEKINEIVEESLNRAYMMRQSILKQAFEGRI